MPASLTIGSRPDCDLVLNSPGISGRHCRLVRDSAGTILEDLNSTNGTYFNGQRVMGTIPINLTATDTIHLGTYLLTADRVLALLDGTGPSKHPGSPSDSPPRLRLRTGELVIGRGKDCDEIVDLPTVSARHARIFRAGGAFLIEDLGSSNGTYVNGTAVSEPVAVKAGDVIGLGSSPFVLDIDFRPGEVVGTGTEEIPQIAPAVEPVLDHQEAVLKVVEPDRLETSWRPGRLVALLVQSPIVALLIIGLLGGGPPAPILFAVAVAVLWFGISSAAVSGLVDRACLRSGFTQTGGSSLVSRLLVLGGLCAVQTLVAWGIVSGVLALRAPAPLTLGLLLLATAVGVSLGLLIVALTPRRDVAWSAPSVVLDLVLVLLLLLLFGGLWPASARVPVVSSVVPSRWVFEGLLILESGEDPEGGLVQRFFPADSDRMGLAADALALSFMLIGFFAAAVFIAVSRTPDPRELPAVPAAGT